MGSFFGRRHAANDPYADTTALVVVNRIVGYKSEPTSRAKRKWQATRYMLADQSKWGVNGRNIAWPQHWARGGSAATEPKLDVA